MNSIQKGIITLIRSGLTGESLQLPVEFDLEQAYPQIMIHQIPSLCYIGAVRCGVDKKLPVMQKLFQIYCRCIQQSEQQMNEVTRICAAFDANGIDHMPLKGCNLKKLYPKPEMRLMGDADILIREEQYERIRPVMRELGFNECSEGIESEYDYKWDSAFLHLELHWRVVTPKNRLLYTYLGDGWKRTVESGNHRYSLSEEDEFIYIFTHFVRHYRDGGIGIRHAVDLWVYKSACPELDEAYIYAEMKKLQLLEFYQNVQHLLSVWFEEAKGNEKTMFIGDHIFRSGAWGRSDGHAIATGARAAQTSGSIGIGKVRKIIDLAFPSLPWMKLKYPVLKKVPFLLPFFWVYRWIAEIMFRRNNIKRHIQKINLATPENIQTYRQSLNYVGLDFDFED